MRSSKVLRYDKCYALLCRPQFFGIAVGSSLMGVFLGLMCSLVRRACVVAVALARLNRVSALCAEDELR